MRIVFMGTPEISAVALEKIVSAGENVVLAVTREDKPRGRGNVMTPTPVKTFAEAHGIDVICPKTLRDEAFEAVLKRYAPDLIVVVAFGKILPKNVLEFPTYGCINLHVSLLPKYRGAAPMQRAVMNGEKQTGVTVMYMDEGLDTGDMIYQEAFPIGPEDDFETVHDTSARVGGDLLLKAISAIRGGTAPRIRQDESQATYAAKIEKEDCKVDFTKSASVLDAQIRGVTPIPTAFAYQGDKMLKIIKAIPTSGTGKPGEVIDTDDRGEGSITVACGKGALRITRIVPEGKGKMSAGDYLRGRKIQKGDVLS